MIQYSETGSLFGLKKKEPRSANQIFCNLNLFKITETRTMVQGLGILEFRSFWNQKGKNHDWVVKNLGIWIYLGSERQEP